MVQNTLNKKEMRDPISQLIVCDCPVPISDEFISISLQNLI